MEDKENRFTLVNRFDWFFFTLVLSMKRQKWMNPLHWFQHDSANSAKIASRAKKMRQVLVEWGLRGKHFGDLCATFSSKQTVPFVCCILSFICPFSFVQFNAFQLTENQLNGGEGKRERPMLCGMKAKKSFACKNLCIMWMSHLMH